jgi:hypothetical protein
MRHLVSFFEAKSKHHTDYHLDKLSDILVEFTDDSIFELDSIIRDGSSSKTFVIKLSVSNDTVIKKGLGRYVRSWNDELEMRYDYNKMESYLSDNSDKVLKRLKLFKYFKYRISINKYNGRVIISVSYRPNGLKKSY